MCDWNKSLDELIIYWISIYEHWCVWSHKQHIAHDLKKKTPYCIKADAGHYVTVNREKRKHIGDFELHHHQ